MNPSQYAGILRIVLPAALSFAVGKGWITQDIVAQIGSVLAAVVASGGWSAASLSTSSMAQTVSSVDGLQVKVSTLAPIALQRMAADPAIPNVVRAS